MNPGVDVTNALLKQEFETMMKKKREDEYYNQKLNIQKKPPVENVLATKCHWLFDCASSSRRRHGGSTCTSDPTGTCGVTSSGCRRNAGIWF
mmetsp:Transcript_3557/g.12529  ORF Transcript_3557/g.12529 Transcript_3557/m.12529 type:complete len:92 (+) Transcript_3557:231-506(+)